MSETTAKDSAGPAWFSVESLRAVLPAWLTARLLVLIGFAVAQAIASEVHLTHLESLHLDEGLLTWDGDWYWHVASDGYANIPREALRFFPLYPLIGWLLSFPLGGSIGAALVLAANGFALVATMFVRNVVIYETDDRRLADRTAWYLSIFPSAFVFVFAYSESLFLVCAAAFFLTLRRRRWWPATALGALAALTRPVGILLVVPAVIEAARGLKGTPVGEKVARLFAVAGPGLGLLAFLGWVGWRFGDWLLPASIQSDLRAGVQDPVTRLIEGVEQIITESQLDAPNVAFALLFIVLLIPVARRLPASYTAYTAVSLIIALSAQNIDSIGRYGIMAFPLMIGLAHLAGDDRVNRIATVVSGGAFVGLVVMALLGGYTP